MHNLGVLHCDIELYNVLRNIQKEKAGSTREAGVISILREKQFCYRTRIYYRLYLKVCYSSAGKNYYQYR
ncbi:unnamed protein product [Colletotrichum noveboracense]|uniref:Uncharacterized protein n=1 Tax=Colletotrichum noveboracense TaxID=2664923 RepID=A0A9W4WKG0_9PEZI|nr:unnamed protein product [Colletotrichum noveboracense]